MIFPISLLWGEPKETLLATQVQVEVQTPPSPPHAVGRAWPHVGSRMRPLRDVMGNLAGKSTPVAGGELL